MVVQSAWEGFLKEGVCTLKTQFGILPRGGAQEVLG